ncbi:MAG: Asp-tRNA(Asn)/Glu-tRNA(Gln) amidotransferase subunit GatC [Candidatus Shapirobacteria bacterium]|nr:Asp-tRNA(Asn)/Glu-tRNA(Gln) amidotransferase subunit GatC [Candidatus Shapirobacteria bacterium]
MSNNGKITLEELQHIAQLSRLEVNGEEEQKLADQLSQTAEYIDVLNELNTDDVLPTAQVNQNKSIFREDVINPSFTQKEALSQAIDTYDGYFKTKATINKK